MVSTHVKFYLKQLGSKGGKARAAKLTSEQRKAISDKALAARWAGHVAKRPSKKLPKV